MVIGNFKAECSEKVKDNKFYGDYVTTKVDSRTIVNQKYEGLIPPKNGIKFTINTLSGDKVTFIIGKYYFTGEYEEEWNENTEYTLSFAYAGHLYEINVDALGQLVSLYEWYSYSDFEDGNEPDCTWRKRSKAIKWELMDI